MTDKLLKLWQAANYIGVSESTLRKYIRAGKISPHSYQTPPTGGNKTAMFTTEGLDGFKERKADKSAPADDSVTQTEKLRYEDRIRTLERKLREAQGEHMTADFISRYYFEATDRDYEVPEWVIEPKHTPAKAPGVPVANWSDWHYGEVVDPDQVEGANRFNVEVADQRIRKLVDRVIDLSLNHMTGADYPGIVVNLGGDMISGNIHDELKQTNQMESIPAVLALVGKIAWCIDRLLETFPSVFVPAVPGNHGRNTHKPQAKLAAHTSFDWMLYKILEMHYADDPRVVFFIPDGFDAYYRVFGHRILLTHGDRLGARGGDGFIGVIGPIMRGAHKLRLSYIARGRDFDTLMMGHWHNEITHPGLRVNDTLKGYDEWAMSMRFTPHPPSQDMFFIHPQRHVTCSWPIQLEDPRHGEDTQTWVSQWKDEK